MSSKTILDSSQAQKTELDQAHNPQSTSLALTTFRGSKIIEEFEAIGAEADVYLVKKDNRQYFLKLYRRGIKLNGDILGTIQNLSHDYKYFAELFEYGFDESVDRYYELSEYISEGNLADVDKKSIDIEPFIQSMNEALNLLHQKKIIHRDLKPSNILFRNIDPQVIVLVDFGVIKEDMSIIFTMTFKKGAYAYVAPEIMCEYFGKEVNYWSLGMVLLEILDKNPLSGLDNNVTLHTLATKDVEIPQKIEKRFKLLLKGLLTRDSKKRWGYSEINAWIKGETPSVYYGYEQGLENTSTQYKFKGNYYSKKELSKVFARGENFEDALKDIRRGYITEFLEKIEEYDEAIKLDEEYESPIEKLIYFIYSQEKRLPFSLYGIVVDIDYLFVLLLKNIEEKIGETEKKIFELLISKKLLTLVEIYESVTSNKIEYRDLIKTFSEDRKNVK